MNFRSSGITTGLALGALGLIFAGLAISNVIQGKRDDSLAMLGLSVVTLLFAGLLLFVGAWRGQRGRQIAHLGRMTEATVTGVRESAFQLDAGGEPACVIEYAYRDDSGELHEGKSTPRPLRRASAWKAGDRAQIRLDEKHPERSVWLDLRVEVSVRTDPVEPSVVAPTLFTVVKRAPSVWVSPLLLGSGYLQTLVPPREPDWFGRNRPYLFMLAGCLLLFMGLRKVWNWWRLVKTGVPVEGTVTAKEPTLIGHWRGRGIRDWAWVVRYRYRDSSGNSYDGKSGYIPHLEGYGLEVGGPCRVKFASAHPGRSVWIASK